MKQHLILSSLLLLSVFTFGQKQIRPDLTKVKDSKIWGIRNRDISLDKGEVHLDSKDNDGLLWLKNINFENGTLEVDIKGRDLQGQSFVGLAFHGLNDTTFDGVYFRAFNFKNPDRSDHSVQYISHPDFTWSKLREEHPGKYENKIQPVPDPNDWFHVKIVVNYPTIEVFVNNASSPSLTVDQISDRKTGWVGFWVGNGSDGNFRNLTITSSK